MTLHQPVTSGSYRNGQIIALATMLSLMAAAVIFLGHNSHETIETADRSDQAHELSHKLAPKAVFPSSLAESLTSFAIKGQVTDNGGHPVPVSSYRRIASTSLFTDSVLLELVPAEHIVVSSDWFQRNHQEGWRLAGRFAFQGAKSIEGLLEQQPDLVVMNNIGGYSSFLDQVRSLNYPIFDAGPMRGLNSLKLAVYRLGSLLKVYDRADRLWQQFYRDWTHLTADLPSAKRRTAIYLSASDTAIYGGTQGTSYHDVLLGAGLIDLAAETFTGWPQYRAEELYHIIPDVIICPLEHRQQLLQHSAMQDHPVWQHPDRIIGIPSALLNDPGFAMLEAATVIHHRVYHQADQHND